MFDKNIFGQTLNQFRRKHGLTIQKLADQCDVSSETIRSYQYARQTPSTKTLLRMCDIFSVTPNHLLYGIYSTPTELDDIAEIESFQKNNHTDQAFETVLEYMITSFPRLEQIDFGSRLRIFRKEANLTAMELAVYTGIKSSTLITMESNQGLPGVEVMLLMCKKLRISPNFLLSKNGNTLYLSEKWYQFLTPKQIKCLAVLTHFL